MDGEIELIRDCHATLIPSEENVLLSKGTKAKLSKNISGGCEIVGFFGLARVDKKDFDAFSNFPSSEVPAGALCDKAAAPVPASSNFGEPTTDELWEVAKTVYDPEIPVNVVDLGLIYRLEVLKRYDGKFCVDSDMTLTAPGCSMGPIIAEELRMRFESLPNVSEARVNIVWDPPWNADMISEEGKMTLGLI